MFESITLELKFESCAEEKNETFGPMIEEKRERVKIGNGENFPLSEGKIFLFSCKTTFIIFTRIFSKPVRKGKKKK